MYIKAHTYMSYMIGKLYNIFNQYMNVMMTHI